MNFRSCVEARVYMLGVLAAMAEDEMREHNVEGWMFGGVTDHFDVRRLKNELRKFKTRCLKQQAKLQGTS